GADGSMWNYKTLFAISAVLAGSALVGQAQTEAVEQEWVGGFSVGRQYDAWTVYLSPTTDGYRAWVDLPRVGVARKEVRQVSLLNGRLRVEFQSDGTTFAFDGNLEGRTIRGSVHQGDTRGIFHLLRVAKVDRNRLDEYVGEYRLARNRLVVV